jgi:pilus assembly protein FimV
MTMILAGTDVSALGLGGIRTLSRLNQPFAGEIDLYDVKPEDIDTLSVKIASQEAFAKAGLERYYYLSKLTFIPEISPQGQAVIRVASREPIREPYMDLLIEVYWPTGQLVKEYTVLLDLPVLAKRQALPVEPPGTPSLQTTAAPATSDTRVTSPAHHIPAPGDGFPFYLGPIGPGAGLWRLARENTPAGASVAQAAMAFYRNNQEAFNRGDINRLITGKTLVIPTRAELFALDAAAAEQEFATALRGGAVRRTPLTDIPPDALSSRLKIAGAAQPTPAPAQGPAVAATPASPGSPRLEQDLLLALESSESTRQEALELKGRIKELETQLADIQNLLQLRNAEFERLRDGSTVAGPGVLGESTITSSVATPEDSTGSPVDDLTSTAQSVPEAPLATETTATPATSIADATADGPGAAPELMPVPLPAPLVDEPVVDATRTPAEQAVQKPAAPQVGSPIVTPSIVPADQGQTGGSSAAETSSTWQSLMYPLVGVAAVTVLGLLGFSWVTARRRRLAGEGAAQDALDSAEIKGSVPSDGHRAPAEKVVETTDSHVNTAQESRLELPVSHDEESESPLSLMSSLTDFDAETDEADVLSEADIYIAYGRYAEARELLLKEMKRYPERLDIKFKLADAYAGTQDAQGLTDLMRSIESVGGDRVQPDQWQRLQGLRDGLHPGGAKPADTAHPLNGIDVQPRVAVDGAGDVLTDSLDLDESESLTLDLSDIQRASNSTSEQSAGRDAQSQVTLLKFGEDTLSDLLSEPVPIGDLVLEHDSFGLELTLPDIDKKDQVNPDPFAGIANAPAADSELVLTLDATRIEPEAKLDSILDSTLSDEPTLARNELTGARPSGAEVSPFRSPERKTGPESALSPEQESLPSEQLSSQWQMDSGIWDETATKLDLARAYIEMADADAAREILEEVIAEGRDEQRSEARVLLERLS